VKGEIYDYDERSLSTTGG